MHYADFLPALAATHPALAETVAPFRSLEHVLDWLKCDGFDLRALDVIAQDEYCHDLIVPLPDSGEYLAFGMT